MSELYTASFSKDRGESYEMHVGTFFECAAKLLAAGHGCIFKGTGAFYSQDQKVVSMAFGTYPSRGPAATNDQWIHWLRCNGQSDFAVWHFTNLSRN